MQTAAAAAGAAQLNWKLGVWIGVQLSTAGMRIEAVEALCEHVS